MVTAHIGIMVGKFGRIRESPSPAITASTMPKIPPMPVRVMASIRNCTVTSPRRAPMALRTPISRVRSLTDTSRMFMTPMPPTSRLTLDRPMATRPTVLVMASNCLISESAVDREKSLSSAGLRRRRERSTDSAWSMARAVSPDLARMIRKVQSSRGEIFRRVM